MDRGLIFRLYRELKKLNNNKTVKKWAKNRNGHSSRDEIQMANRHLKKCLGLLVIREM